MSDTIQIEINIMNNIDSIKHSELIKIIEELIDTIELMRDYKPAYFLHQNEEEAKRWLTFLKEHRDKDELRTLENEIADRFVYKFSDLICNNRLDKKRIYLIDLFLIKSNEYLK